MMSKEFKDVTVIRGLTPLSEYLPYFAVGSDHIFTQRDHLACALEGFLDDHGGAAAAGHFHAQNGDRAYVIAFEQLREFVDIFGGTAVKLGAERYYLFSLEIP